MHTKNLLAIIFFWVLIQTSAAQVKLNLVQIASGFASPVDIKTCGDERLFVVEQAGYIKIMDKHGVINSTPFLDIHTEVNSASNEQGLLTVAFSPNYKQDGFFYVNYITGSGSGSSRISRFQVSAVDSNYTDPATETILLTFSQPFTNHNGATLMFGADGYLYDTQGDGGNSSTPDPYGNGQNTNVYLGKILRLDVSNPDTTYMIPPSNPFANAGGYKPEIWAYGVRNPWRCSFDKLTHDLWIGDVGQNAYEEIDFQPANSTGGQNYGWKCYEGNHRYDTTGCVASGFTWPVYEYGHSSPNGCSVIGGYVYRGAQYANLFGHYLFTDFCSGRFWMLTETSPGVFDPDTLQSFLTNSYSTFGEDNKGELYVAGRSNGRIYHLTDTSSCAPVAFISLHEDTFSGCAPVTVNALFGDSLSYQWYNSLGPVNGSNNIQLQATESGWYKVEVSKNQLGCSAMSDSVYVNILGPDPLNVCHCTTDFCINHDPITLNYITPAGGVYTGNGVVSDTLFSPGVAGLGGSVISYAYTNNNGCPSSTTITLTVNDTTIVNDTASSHMYCQNGTDVNLNLLVYQPGGTFAGSGVTDSLFNPAVAGVGTSTIHYQFTNQYGCVSNTAFNLIVTICTQGNELDEGQGLKIYPNPTNSTLNIEFANDGNSHSIKLTDAIGRVCFSTSPNLQQIYSIDVSNLAKGIYALEVKTGDKSDENKVIIK